MDMAAGYDAQIRRAQSVHQSAGVLFRPTRPGPARFGPARPGPALVMSGRAA